MTKIFRHAFIMGGLFPVTIIVVGLNLGWSESLVISLAASPLFVEILWGLFVPKYIRRKIKAKFTKDVVILPGDEYISVLNDKVLKVSSVDQYWVVFDKYNRLDMETFQQLIKQEYIRKHLPKSNNFNSFYNKIS